ncbi:M4 family metallopeptidase, partial [Stackebrandtia soli]|uniref:M4 family metallopeptidase n=1 Tax=Stackebrandtia soli TaxID=1892856 RepID=UPI0039EBBA84
ADTAQPDVTSTALTSADALVRAADPRLHLSSADEATAVSATHTLGLTFVSYERTYRGLPVVGGDFVIAVDDKGETVYTSVAQDEVIDLDTIKPKLSASSARSAVGADASTAELVVLAWDDPALSYVSTQETVDEDGAPILRDTYVDAMTGEVLTTVDRVFAGTGSTHYNGFPGTVEFGTTAIDGHYVMKDADRLGVSCAEEGGDPMEKDTDSWGDGTGTDLATACVDAMYAAGQEWDMLSAWLDRDGIDGEGKGFPMYVGMSMVNAYWTGSSAHFGHSSDEQRQLTPMDIVAHELGHGIFQFTPGGSSGGNETGGLNEGAGDIFGALTEWYAAQPADEGHDPADYLVGEEGGLSTVGEPIRNMYDPAALDDPACWSTDIPNTEVHAGAGPINHWFYLLAEGTEPGDSAAVPGSTTCDGSTIAEGLGIETAGKIFMGALMGKTSGWTYEDTRVAALEFAASSDLFTTCAEYDATKTAFDAISVPATADPTCSK